MSTKILAVVGTRPEAIKMAPVILALRNEPWADLRVLATAQHRQMLDQVFSWFGIDADIDLNIMRPRQSLPQLTARLMTGLDEVLEREEPAAVLAQGDTTSVMTTALGCFYRNIPFGHVEAGLRSGDLASPFPEEANRVVAGMFARWHFAPTEQAKQNLLAASISEDDIDVTGNTVIDALLETSRRDPDIGIELDSEKPLVLITAHRRENFGRPFEQVCAALSDLARRNPGIQFLYPVHPNPNVREIAYRTLSNLANFILCEPLDYASFVAAMKRALFIISDSGGVQEEAPALATPVLVLREETERPEAVQAGVVKLVGTDHGRIVAEAQDLIDDPDTRAAMALGISPFGDGNAAVRIVSRLRAHFAGKND
ncbi:MAG: non-hydrolyzing UDP-N-acetylglucosamine 2-epimerase [Rhizobiaceae bacterium]